MIIIIAVVVALGVYEIINSVGYDESINKCVSNDKNSIIELINNIENNIIKEKLINHYLNNNILI